MEFLDEAAKNLSRVAADPNYRPPPSTICYGPYWTSGDAQEAAGTYISLVGAFGWIASIHEVRSATEFVQGKKK